MTTGGAAGSSMTTGGAAGAGDGTTLAIHKLLIGDTTPNGQPSSTAWKGYGFNLDGKVSDAASLDLCKPAAGAKPSAVYPDGDGGIDNNWGKMLMPIFTSLSMDFSTQVNDSIAKGDFSVLVRINGIAPGATGPYKSEAFTGATLGKAPAWSGSDVWQVRSDSLDNGDITMPRASFPSSQVSLDAMGQRVWQSIDVGEITLVLQLSGFPMTVPIHNARMWMVLSSDNQHAASGMIGGLIDTEALIAEMAKVAGSFDPALCPPSSTFDSIAQQFRQASDILLDGSQDPTKTCNAISIGLGFEADAALLGGVFDPPVAPDPCN